MIEVIPSPRWYVFQTGSNQEFFAERWLNFKHFDTYVPYHSIEKRRLGVIIGYQRQALFRGYGFVRFDIAVDRWRRIWEVQGVKRLLSTSPDCPIPMPEGSVESLQFAALNLSPATDIVVAEPEPMINPLLIEGQEVEVIDGPLAGNVGIVQSTSNTRAKILMDVLGSKTPVSFRLVNLRTT